MSKIYLLVIAVALVVILSLAACAPGWGQPGWAGGGMMGGRGGMMGSGGMMGGSWGNYNPNAKPIAIDQAKAMADRYLASLNNPDLSIAEFEEYSYNFYLSITERSTGRGAIEVIIDRYSGSLQPEPQGMMWNGKYSMMGSYQQAQMSVTQQRAMKIAQDYVDVAYPGTEADEIVSYYGYYTIMTTLEGKHYGMLSVNGYTGAVWYHTWHGAFIGMEEFE